MKRKKEETPNKGANKHTKTNDQEIVKEKEPWTYNPLVNYPTKGLTLCEKGCLNAHKHFYVEQTLFIKDTLIGKALQQRLFFSLQGSPNSGKTSMIVNSIIPTIQGHKENRDYLLLYMDLSEVMMDWMVRRNNKVTFEHCFMEYALKRVKSKAKVPQSILSLFSYSSPYCPELKKKIVLFMDHADVVHKLTYEERKSFVETWLRIAENRGQFSLYSIAVIGHSVVRPFSIRDEEKNVMVSPFKKHAYMPYFTKDELFLYASQFLKYRMNEEILERIYDRYTYGHIGQSILMLKHFRQVYEDYNYEMSIEDWEDNVLTTEFWDFLKTDQFHAKIFDALSNDRLMTPMIRWLQDERHGRGLALDLSIEDELARIGVIQLSRSRFHLTSHLMRDLIETTYTCPPLL